jgi:lipopolysaccharide transport system ATP-binding protein
MLSEQPGAPFGPAENTNNGDVVVAVRNLGKLYQLYDRPQDRLKQAFLWGRKQLYREFWALRNVSFEVRRGEAVGIIGRNGAGKSTLLQIIGGTLSPTTGEVRINGRVAALLELGSGFNPEFTGRENVYLNGAILGLSRKEMDERFDEIAAFADIGQFIDQPVKLYSSGMYMRLAFSVQAFIPKEMLIVDEVLAVGDEAFQRKCMALLEKFQANGGTVLLVSHDTQTIVRQCERCLLLSHGELVADDDSKAVTDLYQRLMYSDPQEFAEILAKVRQRGLQWALKWSQEEVELQLQIPENVHNANEPPEYRPEPRDWFDPNLPKTNEVSYGNGDAEIIEYGMYNRRDKRVNILVMGERYEWMYKVRFYQEAYHVHFGMMMKTIGGLDVAGIATDRENILFEHISASSLMEVRFSIKLNLVPGTYFLNAGVMGVVNGERVYLHRRVDVDMIRVLPCDTREPYGLAYLEPEITCLKVS